MEHFTHRRISSSFREHRLCFDLTAPSEQFSKKQEVKKSAEAEQKKIETDAKLAKVRGELDTLKKQIADASEKKQSAEQSEKQTRPQLRIVYDGLNALSEEERKPLLEDLGSALRVRPEEAMKRLNEILNQQSVEQFMKDIAALENYVPGNASPFIDLTSAEGTEKLIARYVNSEQMRKGVWDPLRQRFGNRAVEIVSSLIIGGIQSYIADMLATKPFALLENSGAGEYIEMGRQLAKDMHRRSALNAWRRNRARELSQEASKKAGSRVSVSVDTLPPITDLEALGITSNQMTWWDQTYDRWAQNARRLRAGNGRANVGRMPNFDDARPERREAYEKYLATLSGVTAAPAAVPNTANTAPNVRGGLDLGPELKKQVTTERIRVNNISGKELEFYKSGNDYKVKMTGDTQEIDVKNMVANNTVNLTDLFLRGDRNNTDAGTVKLCVNNNQNGLTMQELVNKIEADKKTSVTSGLRGNQLVFTTENTAVLQR